MPVFNDHLIPLEGGHAVSRGWLPWARDRPAGITLHWTATRDLALCRKLLGGPDAELKGRASAHFGVGRTADEGIDRYVTAANRSWHAGVNQTLRWDGSKVAQRDHTGSRRRWTGARTTIGIEIVNVGYARKGIPAGPDWIRAAVPSGSVERLIEPWPEAQLDMLVGLCQYLQQRWPHLTWRDYHGHADLCPGYKEDVIGFPFARLLRRVFDQPEIPDIWSPYQTIEGRQAALVKLKFDLGSSGPEGDGVDGSWGRRSDAALRTYQRRRTCVEDGYWTQTVSRCVYADLNPQEDFVP